MYFSVIKNIIFYSRQPVLSFQEKKKRNTNHQIAPPFDELGETERITHKLIIRINNTNQYILTYQHTKIISVVICNY